MFVGKDTNLNCNGVKLVGENEMEHRGTETQSLFKLKVRVRRDNS